MPVLELAAIEREQEGRIDDEDETMLKAMMLRKGSEAGIRYLARDTRRLHAGFRELWLEKC